MNALLLYDSMLLADTPPDPSGKETAEVPSSDERAREGVEREREKKTSQLRAVSGVTDPQLQRPSQAQESSTVKYHISFQLSSVTPRTTTSDQSVAMEFSDHFKLSKGLCQFSPGPRRLSHLNASHTHSHTFTQVTLHVPLSVFYLYCVVRTVSGY